MRNAPSILPKIVAVFLAVLLFSNNCLFANKAELTLWQERILRHPGTSLSRIQPVVVPQAKGIDVVRPYGTIRKIFKSPVSNCKPETIIHIQDVHGNLEAQKNIAGAIRALSQSGQLGAVALEGAFGAIDLTPFQTFPDQAAVKKVADRLLETDKISGPIYTLLTANLKNLMPLPVRAGDRGGAPAVVGVDDPIHYGANVNAYRTAHSSIKNLKSLLENQRRVISEKKKEIFNAGLLVFDSQVEAYRKGKISIGTHLSTASLSPPLTRRGTKFREGSSAIAIFTEALKLEKSLNFSRVEAERAHLFSLLMPKLGKEKTAEITNAGIAYRSGKLSHADFYSTLSHLCEKNGVPLSNFPAMRDYVRYVLLTDKIDAEELLREIQTWERQTYESLATTQAERDLIAAARRLYLRGKLADFALTREEWEEYKTNENRESKIDQGVINFEAFYREAEMRDHKMAENLIAFVPRTPSFVLLVTGGFHSSGIDDRLVKAGYSVISFVPKITKLDTENGSAYLSAFSREKTPLDRLFEGQKLFLAKEPFSHGTKIFVAVNVAALALAAHTLAPSTVTDWLSHACGWIDVVLRLTIDGVMQVSGAFPAYSGENLPFKLDVRPDQTVGVSSPILSSAAPFFSDPSNGVATASFGLPWWGLVIVMIFGLCGRAFADSPKGKKHKVVDRRVPLRERKNELKKLLAKFFWPTKIAAHVGTSTAFIRRLIREWDLRKIALAIQKKAPSKGQPIPPLKTIKAIVNEVGNNKIKIAKALSISLYQLDLWLAHYAVKNSGFRRYAERTGLSISAALTNRLRTNKASAGNASIPPLSMSEVGAFLYRATGVYRDRGPLMIPVSPIVAPLDYIQSRYVAQPSLENEKINRRTKKTRKTEVVLLAGSYKDPVVIGVFEPEETDIVGDKNTEESRGQEFFPRPVQMCQVFTFVAINDAYQLVSAIQGLIIERDFYTCRAVDKGLTVALLEKTIESFLERQKSLIWTFPRRMSDAYEFLYRRAKEPIHPRFHAITKALPEIDLLAVERKNQKGLQLLSMTFSLSILWSFFAVPSTDVATASLGLPWWGLAILIIGSCAGVMMTSDAPMLWRNARRTPEEKRASAPAEAEIVDRIVKLFNPGEDKILRDEILAYRLKLELLKMIGGVPMPDEGVIFNIGGGADEIATDILKRVLNIENRPFSPAEIYRRLSRIYDFSHGVADIERMQTIFPINALDADRLAQVAQMYKEPITVLLKFWGAFFNAWQGGDELFRKSLKEMLVALNPETVVVWESDLALLRRTHKVLTEENYRGILRHLLADRSLTDQLSQTHQPIIPVEVYPNFALGLGGYGPYVYARSDAIVVSLIVLFIPLFASAFWERFPALFALGLFVSLGLVWVARRPLHRFVKKLAGSPDRPANTAHAYFPLLQAWHGTQQSGVAAIIGWARDTFMDREHRRLPLGKMAFIAQSHATLARGRLAGVDRNRLLASSGHVYASGLSDLDRDGVSLATFSERQTNTYLSKFEAALGPNIEASVPEAVGIANGLLKYPYAWESASPVSISDSDANLPMILPVGAYSEGQVAYVRLMRTMFPNRKITVVCGYLESGHYHLALAGVPDVSLWAAPVAPRPLVRDGNLNVNAFRALLPASPDWFVVLSPEVRQSINELAPALPNCRLYSFAGLTGVHVSTAWENVVRMALVLALRRGT